jgi:Tol biopolymer transport system component
VRRLAALLAMAVFGVGVYATLGALKSRAGSAAQRPAATQPRVDAAGTMFLVQQGSLYRLQNRLVTRLGAAPSGQWVQPVLSPDHTHLMAVDRQDQFSDLYMLDLNGKVTAQLTDNHGGGSALQHWAFYPRFSPNGQTLYYSYDAPKFAGNFRVDMAIWSVAVGAPQKTARRASTPNDYTGGDTYPIPLASGGLLYSKYDVGNGATSSQLWYQAGALSPGKALTTPEQGCGQPALSPDGLRVAMV